MPITWPAGLPQKPQRSGLNIDPQDVTIRSEMDYGPSSDRPRTTYAVDIFTMRFLLISATIEGYLTTFYETTTSYGSVQFEWLHPISGTNYYWKFAKPPRPLAYHGGGAVDYEVVLKKLKAVP
jgi:hypothetical protein